MTPSQLEHWVLRIFDQVRAGQVLEDSRVELKRSWISPSAAARRIAAHANASRGDPVLWIVGLDERTGIISERREDLSTWWPQVEAEFEGGAPGLFDLWVHLENGGVTALLFDTARAPYVVRNPMRNQPGAGPFEFEVPWRDGARTRSARRSELLQMLVPLQTLPSVEVLSAGAVVMPDDAGSFCFQCNIQLYIVPRTSESLVIPFHRCEARLESAGFFGKPSGPKSLQLMPEYTMKQRPGKPDAGFDYINNSLTVHGTNREVILRGPGVVEVVLENVVEPPKSSTAEPLTVDLRLVPAGFDRAVSETIILEPTTATGEVICAWRTPPDRSRPFSDIVLNSGWRLRSGEPEVPRPRSLGGM
jgi:hypothetical protein